MSPAAHALPAQYTGGSAVPLVLDVLEEVDEVLVELDVVLVLELDEVDDAPELVPAPLELPDVVSPVLVDVLDPLLVGDAPPAPKSESPETPPQAPRAAPEHRSVAAARKKRFM
jgi:hypothetical protein